MPDNRHDKIRQHIDRGDRGFAQTRRSPIISWEPRSFGSIEFQVVATDAVGMSLEDAARAILKDLARGEHSAAASAGAFHKSYIDDFIGELSPPFSPDITAENRSLIEALENLKIERPEIFFD